MKNKTKKIVNIVIYGIGITVILGSHTAMLIMGGLEPQYMQTHSIMNLVAGFMVAYSYITKKK